MLRVSIVIPVAKINSYIRESLTHIASLDYDNYEVLVCPDADDGVRLPGATVVPTGQIGPAQKRDLAMEAASGDVIAFLDDDAYPRSDWLRNAVAHFADPAVAAVGGPAVTARSDNIRQKASGFVYSSLVGGGGVAYRYKPARARQVDDLPSVNLLVRKEVVRKIGGFDTSYWPGEDTKLCLDITSGLGMTIIYDPEVFVWHHRRPLFIPHLRQVYNYAVHRGFFVKRLPETSLRLQYFAPSLFVLGLSVGSLSFLFGRVATTVYLTVMSAYLVAALLSSLAEAGVRATPLVTAGVVTTHVAYGLGFIRGLLGTRLER